MHWEADRKIPTGDIICSDDAAQFRCSLEGENIWRPAVLALLRAAEALKPVLARVGLARFGVPGALGAGEGPNGAPHSA